MTTMTTRTASAMAVLPGNLGLRRTPAPPAVWDPPDPHQWSLPLDGTAARQPAVLSPAPPRLSLVPSPGYGISGSCEHRAHGFVQALIEVAGGARPVQQLARLMTPAVYDAFAARMRRVARVRSVTGGNAVVPRGQVASVRVLELDARRSEVAARMVQNGRSRAIALRLELRIDHLGNARWVCTALVWG